MSHIRGGLSEQEFLERQLEEAARKSIENFGEPEHIFHPDYGWIKRDNKWTQVGEKFLEDIYKIGNK